MSDTVKQALTKKNRPFAVGDKVRIKTGKKTVGGTLWEITQLKPGMVCYLREAGTNYAEQRFDTSLLVHA